MSKIKRGTTEAEVAQFEQCLKWIVEKKLPVRVQRIGESDAEIGAYHVGFCGGEWCVWENDEHFARLSEHSLPKDAVCIALSYAIPDALDSEMNGG